MCRACDQIPIHRLIRDPSISDVEIIEHVKEFHDVNLRSAHCGKTPLMAAAYYGRKELVEAFVADFGAVPFAVNEATGDTAAHYAVLSVAVGHVRQCSTLMTLFECGVPDNVRNRDGYDPIELARKYRNEAVMNEQQKRNGNKSEAGNNDEDDDDD